MFFIGALSFGGRNIGSGHVLTTVPLVSISVLEAATIANGFARAVNVEKEYRLLSVNLRTDGGKGVCVSPVYQVVLRKPSPTSILDVNVYVDAVSGDVVQADNFYGPQFAYPDNSRITDKWLGRLGLKEDLRFDSVYKRYELYFEGHPFFNVGDNTSVGFELRGNNFARYEGLGKVPPMPVGTPNISAKVAEEIADSLYTKRFGATPPNYNFSSKLGAFYDDQSLVSYWVWQVRRIVADGSSFVTYVNAESGREIPFNRLVDSRWTYLSRLPRAAVQKQSGGKVDSLTFFARKWLHQLGYPEDRFTSSVVYNGLCLRDEQGDLFAVGPDNTSVEFQLTNSSAVIDENQALKSARKLWANVAPKYPAGSIRERIESGYGFTRVEYVQNSLGLDYLDKPIASISFAADGSVNNFATTRLAPEAPVFPGRYLGANAMKIAAQRYADAHLEKDTDRIHNYANVSVNRFGWHVDPKSQSVTLAYSVMIMWMRDVKDWARQGAGRSYLFDAVTGERLSD